MDSIRTANPRYVGAPANMADGRLFTDYRSSCELIVQPKKVTSGHRGPVMFAGFDRRAELLAQGESLMQEDRMFTTWVAGTKGHVDTMVPELNKRLCRKDGCETLVAHPVGLGTGRLTINQPGLATADPETVAKTVTPPLFGTFSSHLPGVHRNQRGMEKEGNPYSAPYGHF
jgi:hypothetical protein